MTEKVIGDSKMCVACGKTIVCRMTAYADYPNKPQWQNEDDLKAHYDKTGKCKNEAKNSEGIDYGTPSTASDPAIMETRQGPTKLEIPSKSARIEDQKLETKRLQEKFKELEASGDLLEGSIPHSVMQMYVRMLAGCDDMGITDEIKRGMLSNQANIRASV